MTDTRATSQHGATAVAGERGERRRVNPITVLIYTLLVVLALIYIYPFLVQLATSFKTDAQAASEPASLRPDPATTAAFEELFTRSDFPLWTFNSAVRDASSSPLVGSSSTPWPDMPWLGCGSAAGVPCSRRWSPSWQCPGWCCSSPSSWS